MLLPQHTYHKPATLDECLAKLGNLAQTDHAAEKLRVVAGGTDVIFNMRLRLFEPDDVVSIRALEELQQIEEMEDGSLRLGAACRLIDLADNPLIQARYPALKQAIDAVASVHIRNIGTLGGNVCLETRCWFTNNSEDWRKGREGCFKTDCEQCHVIPSSHLCHAINNADSPLALIVLDAILTIQSSSGVREVPIKDFYQPDGMQHMALEPGELLTHVTIPPCTDRSVFIKFTPRKGMDFSLGAVAARADGQGEDAENVSLVVGSVSSSPILLAGPAKILEAGGLGDAAIEKAVDSIRDELGEVTNLYGKATYKKQIAKTLV
ncbi:MAG: FAD binding domain-containing protein, partial [Gammaproteobacteria bacterium]